MSKNIYELAVNSAPKQIKIVSSLIADAPVLSNLPMAPSSNGLRHLAEVVTGVNGMQRVAFGGALPKLSISSDLDEFALGIFGGIIEVPEDIVAKYEGGVAGYFSDKVLVHARSFGANAETELIRDGLRAYAISKGRTISASGNGNANSSIICVNWTEGEIQGLYDETFLGKGKMVDLTPMSEGGLYESRTTGESVYGMRVKTNLGLQISSSDKIAALVNIDLENNAADLTAEKIDRLVVMSKAVGSSGTPMLLMHPLIWANLFQFKDRIVTERDPENVNRVFHYWGGVRMIPTYNMAYATEANV